MLRIAVLDDQEEYVDQIQELTKQCMKRMGVSCKFKTYTQVENMLSDLEEKDYFDIYLLDIELPGMSGLDIARVIRKECWSAVIIYITNYVHYAVEAFEVNAFRYIPKGQLEKKLPEALETLMEQLEIEKEECYIIERGNLFERIPYKEIYFLMKEEKYVWIIHKFGTSKVRKSLTEVMEEFGDRDYFVAIDRGYVVNAMHIISLKEQTIILRDGNTLPVSKPRLAEARRKIMEYCR